ncbi:hypothetical protein pb186bvf_019928 [Paramecium bursaria]
MEVDIKIDYQEMSPFTIREISSKMEVSYRQIDKRDFIFFDGLTQSQKFHQIKMIDEQSKLLTGQNQLNNTIVLNVDQLNLQSNLFLLILLYDNQNQKYVENYLDDIQQQLMGLEEHFKQVNIIIIINNKDENKLKINENKYYDDCSAKLFINYKLGKNSASLFIMNKEQDMISLLNLIYLGIAKHFNPKYLLVQELCYKISTLDNYFKNIPQNSAAIVPEKIYKKNYFSSNYLFYQFRLYYNYFLHIQNKQNTQYYDSLNCFYNYEIAKQYIQQYISEFQNATKHQELCNLNLQFCKYVQENNLHILQKNQIEYSDQLIDDSQNNYISDINYQYYDEKQFRDASNTQLIVQTSKQSIKLKKQINYLFLQYYQVNKLQIILIVDYFHLSQYLFFVVILPYYYMHQQTDNQAVNVFIPIIPGFIILGLTYVLILLNIIFNITDPIIIRGYGKKIYIAICKLNQRFYYHDYFGQQNKISQLNQQFNIQKGDLFINVNQEKCQQQKEKDPVLHQVVPQIITYPILWVQNKFFNIIITLINLMYFALFIYLIAYQIQYKIEIKYQMTIIIITLLCVLIILSAIQYKQQCFKYLFLYVFKFIQINLFNFINEAYTKSNQVELNLLASQDYLFKIFYNSIMLFIFIVVDFSNHLNGGVFVGILSIQTLKQFYHQFFIFNVLNCNKQSNSIINDNQIENSQLINDKEVNNEDLIDQKLNTKAEEITQIYLNISGKIDQFNLQLSMLKYKIDDQEKGFQKRFQQENMSESIMSSQQIQSEQSYQQPLKIDSNLNQQYQLDESPIKNYIKLDQQKLTQYPNDEFEVQFPQEQIQRSKRQTEEKRNKLSINEQISKLKRQNNYDYFLLMTISVSRS